MSDAVDAVDTDPDGAERAGGRFGAAERVDVLEQAARSPYAIGGTDSCAALATAVADLDEALGPDFGHSTTRRGSKVGTLAKQGGSAVVDSLIPFRGVVREVSGAAAADRRLAAAVNAGYARRGFLRGVSTAKRCSPAL